MLVAADLAACSPDDATAVLGYLDLPPVGALDDAGGPPDAARDDGYELPAAVRAAVGERRTRAGGRLGRVEDLLGIEGFGADELRATVLRLGDRRRYGHRVTPVWGGPEGKRAFFAMLEGATRFIHVETYVLGGEVGLELARLLARKQREGVEVRLMFCATGFVISGSPSGAGLVSGWSERRSYLAQDRYLRKRIVEELRASGVPFVDTAPIARHWKRLALRRQGVTSARAYERWARARGLPDAWIEEQERIDRACPFGFANVDHRKMAIVDGERAFIGSQNIADSYFYGNELDADARVNVKRWQWHDSSAILEGGAVHELGRLFARRWMLSGGDLFDPDDARHAPPPRRWGDAVVTLDTSIPGMVRLPLARNLPGLLLSMLGADRRPLVEGHNPIRERVARLAALARDELYVEHCYPSDGELLAGWVEEARRLRDFTMIVPRHYDTAVLGFECDRFFPEMLAGGARIVSYRRAIMHSKIAVADGFYVSTGSYNLNLRSARADLELQFFIQCPSYGGAVRDLIRGDLAHGAPVVPRPVDRLRSRASLPVFDAIVRYFIL